MNPILFMQADPADMVRLQSDEELRAINEQLRLAKKRSRFKLYQYPAVRPQDISRALLEVNPTIVHFSGHGHSSGAICCENEEGEAHPLTPAALTALFALFKEHLQCIILNACYSVIQAEALAQQIPYVIGMSNEVADDAAIAFSVGFYQALGAGRTIDDAFKLGCAQIQLENMPDHLRPCLLKREAPIHTPPEATVIPEKVAPANDLAAKPLKPFGEVDCESEVALLQESYSDYYFTETPFSKLTLAPERYLIIGRRGAGKTALCKYMEFQDVIPHAIAIDVNEPAAFQYIAAAIADGYTARELAIPQLTKIWEVVIWAIIFSHLKDKDEKIKAAYQLLHQAKELAPQLIDTLELFLAYPAPSTIGVTIVHDLLKNPSFVQGQEAVLKVAYRCPIIVAFDTLENVDIDNNNMLLVIASLLDAASNFNRKYSSKNIFLKIFLMAEAFPHLKEEVILNPLKSVRDEVYMHWRPKDLMRLICWRFYKYLRANDLLPDKSFDVDWKDHRSVAEKMWVPYFGDELLNGRGLLEKSFPYVLRHTQMRPRQLIVLCDRIAQKAQEANHFPKFTTDDLVEGIREGEIDLADEVLNSYNTVYPKVGKILDALAGISPTFPGKELDKRASYTASEWPSDRYSPFNFRQLVSELGIVGRIRHVDEKTGIVAADFEYASRGRLGLLASDDCAIHPMFYKRLKVNSGPNLKIYPFPDHPDFNEILTD